MWPKLPACLDPELSAADENRRVLKQRPFVSYHRIADAKGSVHPSDKRSNPAQPRRAVLTGVR